MMKHKITPSVDYNKWLKHLDIEIIEPINQKSPKLISKQIRKRWYKALGTSVMNSSLSPLSLPLLLM